MPSHVGPTLLFSLQNVQDAWFHAYVRAQLRRNVLRRVIIWLHTCEGGVVVPKVTSSCVGSVESCVRDIPCRRDWVLLYGVVGYLRVRCFCVRAQGSLWLFVVRLLSRFVRNCCFLGVEVAFYLLGGPKFCYGLRMLLHVSDRNETVQQLLLTFSEVIHQLREFLRVLFG